MLVYQPPISYLFCGQSPTSYHFWEFTIHQSHVLLRAIFRAHLPLPATPPCNLISIKVGFMTNSNYFLVVPWLLDLQHFGTIMWRCAVGVLSVTPMTCIVCYSGREASDSWSTWICCILHGHRLLPATLAMVHSDNIKLILEHETTNCSHPKKSTFTFSTILLVWRTIYLDQRSVQTSLRRFRSWHFHNIRRIWIGCFINR